MTCPKTRFAALTWAAFLSAAPAVAAPDVAAPRSVELNPAQRVPGRVLLKLRGIDAARLEVARADDRAADVVKDLAADAGVELTLVRAVVFGWGLFDVQAAHRSGAPSEDETLWFIERLQRDPRVEAASDEAWMRPLLRPNDPGLGQMWHLDAIGAPAAWDVTRGVSSQRVGVIDTGLLRSHEDVGARAVAGFDFIASSQTANDGNGRDADFNDAGDACNGQPASFHGTHVAGTIGAATDNGRGIAGLNWNAGLVIGRALGRCGGSTVDIMEAAAWMAGAQIQGVPNIGSNKVSVMNLSLGSASSCSSFQQQVVDFVNDQGVAFVAAAGNDGGAVNSPARCSGAIAVAATGPSNSRAPYSSFGEQVTLAAPGGDMRVQGGGVLSTMGPQQNGYRFSQGTSMAAPHVTGAISLVQAVAPSLSPAQVAELLASSGTACGNCGSKRLLQLDDALAALGGTPAPPTTPPPAPPPAGSDDAFEENDAPSQATGAACGVDATLFAAAADRDYFRFTPPAGRQIAVSVDAQNGADLDLYILNSSGAQILARSETATGNERITGTASGSTLLLLMNPYVNPNTNVRHNGPYRLRISCGATAQANADFEPGEVDLDGEDEDEGGGELVPGDVDLDGDGADDGVPPAPEAGPALGDKEGDGNDESGDATTELSVHGGCGQSGAGSPVALAPLGLLGLLGLLSRRPRART